VSELSHHPAIPLEGSDSESLESLRDELLVCRKEVCTYIQGFDLENLKGSETLLDLETIFSSD
jgi:hypothetical protein